MKMKKFLALVLSMCMIFSMSSVVFAEGDGTSENPEILTELTGERTQVESAYEDDNTSYYYTYTVPAEIGGIVMYTFTTTEQDEYFALNVTNNTTNDSTQLIYFAYGETLNGSVKASAGDELSIEVKTLVNYNKNENGVYEDVDLTWTVEMSAVGTASSPEVIETMYQAMTNSFAWSGNTTVATNGDAYYYTYVVEKTGTLNLYIDEANSTDLYFVKYGMGEDDPAIPNSLAELAAEIVVKNGNKTVKYSEGTTNISISTGYGSDTYTVMQMDVTEGDEITIEVSSNAENYDSVAIYFGTIITEPYGAQGNPVVIEKNNQEVTVPAGATYFVSLNKYPFMNYPVSVEGENAVILDYYGEEIEDQTDMEILGVPVDRFGNMTYMFQIKNTGSAEAKYTVSFDMPEGLQLNPKELDTNDSDEHTFDEEWEGYCYYTWIAEKDGIVSFEVVVDVEGANWMYSVDNKTSGVGAPYIYSSDEVIKHISMDVKEGDELSMYISANKYDEEDNQETVVATTTVKFTASEGGVLAPETIEGVCDEIFDKLDSGEFDEAGTGSIVMDMCDEETGDTVATVIPGEVLADIIDALENYDIELDLEVVMDAYTWYISNVEDATPVDLGIKFDTDNTAETVINATADGNKYQTFTIAHNGDFGFDAVLELAVSKDYAGKTVALYWDDNGTLKLVGEKCVVTADGSVKFAMTHASDYVMVIEGTKTVVTPPAPPAPPVVNPDKTGDMAPVAMLLVVAVVASVVVLKKRETAEN